MNKLILIITLCCFVNIVRAQKPGARLNELGLKGNVKEVIEFEYRGKENQENVDTTKDPFKTIIRFDEKGNELEEIRIGGALAGKYVFNYSQDKSIIENQFDVNDKLRGKAVFKYDDKGNQIEFDTYYGADLASVLRVIYKYDDNNNIIEEDQINDQIKIITKSIFLYNIKNQKIEGHRYWNESDDFAKTIYQYDELGNQIKSESYTTSGEFESGYSSIYNNIDEHGNWLNQVMESKGHSKQQGDYLFKHIDKRIITYY